MKKEILLGSHVEFKNPLYLEGSAMLASKYNANCMMIYLGAPQNSKRVAIEKYNYKNYVEKYSSIINPENIIVHAPYITNCANPTIFDFSTNFIIEEIKRMNFIKAKFLVLHPGAYTKFNKIIAYETLEKALKQILKNTTEVTILLETMSGKGTEIGTKIEELVDLIKKINSPRLGICLDTCHVWDAGYNIKDVDSFINYLQTNNFLTYIKVIHLNDSKNDINSHKDRHENIGKGFLGLEVLQKIVFHPLLQKIPKILETPYVENNPIYEKEIKLLLSI